MELKTLTLANFRQFYGRQRIEFAHEDGENVTVVHGANGSGKTTILNAFLWLFYDTVTLPRPERVPSERAVAEAGAHDTVEVRVALEFDHEGRAYTATRTRTYRPSGGDDLATTAGDDDLVVEFVDTDGNHKRRGNPADALRNIMPERLREIFFFDGETIDELSAVGGQEKIRTAIQNIMGLTILERAERHLDTVRKRFEDEASEHGSDELAELYEQQGELEERVETQEEELATARESKREAESELDRVEERLRELEDSRGLQSERDALQSDLADLEDDIESIESAIAERISEDGYLPFAMPAVGTTAEMLQEKRRRGEIPTDIKTRFVRDLLDAEECICGRELVPGTEPHRHVTEWRERAGSSELDETATTIAGQLSEIAEREGDLFESIEDLLQRRSEKRDVKEQKEEQLSEISAKLSDVETEDIADLEERHTDLEAQVSEYDQRIGRIEGRIADLKDDLAELADEIEDAEEESALAETARRRAAMAAYLRDRVQGLFEKYQNRVREQVNDRVNDIFGDIIAKDYYARIDDDYSLRILKDVGEAEAIQVAKSMGERQVASLSFIASLVSLARERYESEEDATYFTGGIYPMIMDSPFGALDPQYQERVSAMLPEMAEQVVVLVTRSQWSDAVEGELGAKTGAVYQLEYADPSEEGVEYEHTEIVRSEGRY